MTMDVAHRTGGNERYLALDQTMALFSYQKDALLEVLNTAQGTFGYLSEEILAYVSDKLSLPLSHVYGVATFFDQFTFEPVGDSQCCVCTDPACSIARGEEVFAAAERYAATSLAGRAMVRRVTCLGLCDQAPAALVDQVARVHLSADDVESIFNGEAPLSRLNVTGEPRIMTGRIERLHPLDLGSHCEDGAFAALERAIRGMTPEEVIEQVKASGVSGRGGAGFPTGLKWQFTRSAAGEPKYVVCNFDESEPGTFKDRLLVQGDPFRILEGMIIAGYAIDAAQGFVFVRGEYPEAAQVLSQAIVRLREAGLLGQHILGTKFHFDVTIRRSAGAYICGEETALFEAIEGNRGHPRTKPPFPTTHGLFGRPTAINNVETLALIPVIIAKGGRWLRQWGTEKSPGVKLFCLSGNVHSPGVIEAPFGITVRQLIERYGGGFQGPPQAILLGGAAGGLLHPDYLDTPLASESLDPLGLPMGSGVVMVFNEEVNLLHVLKSVAAFFAHETCGHCLPCRVGTHQVYKLLEKIAGGTGVQEDVEKLERLCLTMRDVGLCGLGRTAPSPILSSLRYFRNAYESSLQ